MRLTQFVIFEIAEGCNRGREHWQCPNTHPDRWANSVGRRPMTDAQILEVAVKATAEGFAGMFAFHHYCEPLTAWPRLRALIPQIRERVPGARFLLWTNGDLFPDELSGFSGLFSKMMVTNYAGRDLSRLDAICPEIHQIPVGLDWRVKPPTTEPEQSPHCIRPYLEIIFDYFGNLRVCCMDWRNEVQIGNIHDAPWEDLLPRWLALRDRLAAEPMAEDAPRRCLTCGTRYLNLAHYVPEVAARTLEYLT